MDGWTVLISILGAIAGLGSVIAIIYKSRAESTSIATTTKATLDARIDARIASQLEGAWLRIDALGRQIDTYEKREVRRNGAITRILRDIAKQWPNAEGPNLNPADILEIEETIPSSWFRKN